MQQKKKIFWASPFIPAPPKIPKKNVNSGQTFGPIVKKEKRISTPGPPCPRKTVTGVPRERNASAHFVFSQPFNVGGHRFEKDPRKAEIFCKFPEFQNGRGGGFLLIVMSHEFLNTRAK